MLRGSEESQGRVLALIGGTMLLCVVLTAAAIVINPFGSRPADEISVMINTPYVGQGVEAGTAVVLHGVEVGKVTDVTLSPGGGVRLATDLHAQPLAGLTDSMNIDFRPINYFGVPGVNIIPTSGGQAIRNGTEINLVPKGNFTLSELLSELGGVSAAALTPQLISVVDRVTRYTDAFNPLFETLVIVTKTITKVQRVSTAQLLANTAPITTAFPPFGDQLIKLATRFSDFNYYPEHGDPRGLIDRTAANSAAPSSPAASVRKLVPPFLEYTYVKNSGLESEDFTHNVEERFLEIASGGLFAAIGKLVTTHADDLLPLIHGIKAITDTTPSLLRPADIAKTLAELRSRFEKLYGGNGEQRALRVRVLLDSLPGVAAPLGIVAGGHE